MLTKGNIVPVGGFSHMVFLTAVFIVLVIKSPKQLLETYCFCSISYYYYYYSPPPPFFLFVAHELVHSRSQELLDRIS